MNVRKIIGVLTLTLAMFLTVAAQGTVGSNKTSGKKGSKTATKSTSGKKGKTSGKKGSKTKKGHKGGKKGKKSSGGTTTPVPKQ